MKSTKILALVLVVVMSLGMLASCFGGKTPDQGGSNVPPPVDNPTDEIVIKEGDYTYNSYTSALGSNWNPHTWETSADSGLLSYVTDGFVGMAPLNTEDGLYQWTFNMATSIEDVTAANQADLTKYGSDLPEGVTDASEVTEGYVYEIKLNPNAKWQTGEAINADSYIYSMEKLLNSKYRNYRANLYISGESAVAGGLGYYNSEAPIFAIYDDYEGDEEVETFLSLNEELYFAGYSFASLKEMGYVTEETFNALKEMQNGYGYIPVTEENIDLVKQGMLEYLTPFGLGSMDAVEYYFTAFLFYISGIGEKAEWDSVGLYKVDDYTIHYVCQYAIERNYFLTSCTDTWLVHPATYENNTKEEGGLFVTTYCTTADTTVSYGPYMMQSFEDAKQVVFVQNPNWYGYQTTESGYLYSITNYEVDGKNVQQYQTTKIVIDVLTQEAAYTAFLKGELMDYAPKPEELFEYTLSDRLTRVDETYTMSFFFNTDEEVLKNLDANEGNENSIVLSNYSFRKAFSLAFNRADFVTVTEGYTPAYSLMNKLYHYDIYNDPTSSYRASEPAMQAICNLYGVKYGEGEIYATLEEAYNSITGFNLTEAKALMKQACDELVAAGKYTAGEPITIKIAWKAGAMEDTDNSQVQKVQDYLNAAVAGSGFGAVTIIGVGSLNDRYADVPAGKFAIGYGAWGGAAFYPFRNFQVYCDPSQYKINEAGCWKPATEELTINVLGEEVTMTWKEWSNALIGTGPYANVSNDIKLEITAYMEQKFLEFYYRIPLCGTTVCSLLSYKADYYTWDYNIMYGFGGLALMTYNYTDAEWAAYVAEQGGVLNYK